MSNKEFFSKQQRVLEDTSEAKHGISAFTMFYFLNQLSEEDLKGADLFVVAYPSFKGKPRVKKVIVEYGSEGTETNGG